MAPSSAPRPPWTPALLALLTTGIAACAAGAPGDSGSGVPAPAPDDWVWTFRTEPPRALYGPPASEAFMVVECVLDGPSPRSIRHTVYAPADSGATATLTLAGNGEGARLPLGAVRTELGPEWIWEGSTPWAEVAGPFTGGPGAVAYALDDSTAWSVPDPGPVRRVLDSCGEDGGG